ncbi:DUF2255 family protein [Streptomyces sp. NPDC101152]|uniref:DUF2255 family protein n=1 Tax=Streptomyces sp. NPDC101152 TaxID=3366116 RepID=UPI0038095AE1
MSTWTAEELARIAGTDDFHIAPYREDGVTPGTMTWVWSVPVDGDVYVRSATPGSRWFAAAAPPTTRNGDHRRSYQGSHV